MSSILKKRGIKILIHQPSYSLINRWIEKDLSSSLKRNEIGCIAFSPLAQGMLSKKYLKGIPKISRANQTITSLDKKLITKRNIQIIQELNMIAKNRVIYEKNEQSIKDLEAAEIGLISCHDYDKLRKRMMVWGLSAEEISYIGLEAIEERTQDLMRYVEIHEFKY